MTWLEQLAATKMPPSSTSAEGARVQIAVGGERLLQRLLRRGEARRIGDDEADSGGRSRAARSSQSKASSASKRVARGVEAVEREVGARVGERGGGDVDGGDAAGAGERGVDGEAAGVAEEVDDVDAGGEGADGAAVLALVEEEAGLLAVQDVDGEADVVLADLDGRRRRAAVERLAAAAARALVDVGDAERAAVVDDGGGDRVAPDADGVAVEAQRRRPGRRRRRRRRAESRPRR